MREPICRAIRTAIAAAALCVLVPGCDNTPTVPVPPPEVPLVKKSDIAGVYIVSGAPGTTLPDDIVLIFNEDKGKGVMQTVDDDGSYEVEVEGAPGDSLVVQVKRDMDLSEEETIEAPAN